MSKIENKMAVAPRDPAEVMRLARMGSFHQSRLSFMRVLLRRLVREAWTFETHLFDIDARGVGQAVYTAHGPDRSYSLVAFANDLPPEKRSDRVIATEWDATFTLFDGVPSEKDIARLKANVPLQEAGRIRETELSLSRANRSVRLWDHVVDALSRGRQPDMDLVDSVGYLMRTTAVYGSGKFGAADREMIAQRPEFRAPFQVEMLSVFLTRAFVMDLVEHMARARAPETAVSLAPELRRKFGIGNSTGLGMAPFLMTHPVLINNWIAAKEWALARVRSLPMATVEAAETFKEFARRAQIHSETWTSDHPIQMRKLDDLREDMATINTHLATADLLNDQPWDRLWIWGKDKLSLEGQEQLASLLLEPYGDLVDGLSDCMYADEQDAWRINGTMQLSEIKNILEDVYDWALEIDWTERSAQARVWYTSEEKLEPRLGERFEEDIEAYEQALCPGRDAARLYKELPTQDGPLATFLLAHPEHRHIVRRAQIAARYPYAEIRDNTIDAKMLPIDLLRAKLSFFGACRFDPRSDRWLRINMFQHAPYPSELMSMGADGWAYPPLPRVAE